MLGPVLDRPSVSAFSCKEEPPLFPMTTVLLPPDTVIVPDPSWR